MPRPLRGLGAPEPSVGVTAERRLGGHVRGAEAGRRPRHAALARVAPLDPSAQPTRSDWSRAPGHSTLPWR